MEGYLYKRGAVKKSWRRRYFVISGKNLDYYKNSDAYFSSGGTSRKTGTILMVGATVEEMPDTRFSRANCFSITPRQQGRQYFLQAESPEELNGWVQALREQEKKISVVSTSDEVRGSVGGAGGRGIAPKFQEADHCAAPTCLKKFTISRRRHHCRNCGQSFCGKCSPHECRLPRLGIYELVRVCVSCYRQLNMARDDQEIASTEKQSDHWAGVKGETEDATPYEHAMRPSQSGMTSLTLEQKQDSPVKGSRGESQSTAPADTQVSTGGDGFVEGVPAVVRRSSQFSDSYTSYRRSGFRRKDSKFKNSANKSGGMEATLDYVPLEEIDNDADGAFQQDLNALLEAESTDKGCCCVVM